MKSTMKSTFAIIAVVLMVLVAVVPMVGVFTAPSDAATAVVTDPVEAEDVNITLNVMLYKANMDPTTTTLTNEIQIVYGKYTQTGKITDATAGITFTIYELAVDKVTITYVDKDGKAVDDYSSVTLEKLVAGRSYKADLVAGHNQTTATFKFKDGANITKTIMGTDVVEAQYEILNKIPEGTDFKYESVEKGKFVMTATADSLTGTFLYTAFDTTEIQRVIVVTSFKAGSSLPITFDNTKTGYVAFTGAAVEFNAKETLVSIYADEDVHFSMDASITGKKGTDTLTFNAIKKTIGKGAADFAYFTVIIPDNTDAYDLTMKVTYNSTSDTKTGIDALPTKYEVNHAFFGQVTMKTNYVQDGTLTAKVKSTEGADKTVSVNVKTTDGYFLVFNDKFQDGGDITEAKFKTSSAEYVPDGALTIDINDENEIELDYTGYSEVEATLALKAIDGTVGPAVVGKTVKVSGATTFGSLDTGAAGALKFMAETGKNIILSVDGATLSGDISIVVGSADPKTIYMSTQLFAIGVEDALGTSLDLANPLVPVVVTVHIYDKKTGGSEIEVISNTVEYDLLTDTYYGEARADWDLTKTFVTVASAGYTFGDERIAFTKGLVVNAAESDYLIGFLKADGTTPVEIGDGDASVYLAEVYKNSVGDFIYTYETTAIATSADGFIVLDGKKLAYVNKTASDISEKPTEVYVIVTENDIQDFGIFKTTYLIDVDEDGEFYVVSAYDSFSADLTRIDEVTPIAGVKVEISNDGFTSVLDTAYTQADGSFTVYSDVALTDDDTTIRFGNNQNTGYTFTVSPIYDLLGLRVDAFTATLDKYSFNYYDADGSKIDVSGEGIAKRIDGVAIPAAPQYDWEAGDTIQLTMLDGTKTYRTFEAYTLTADDVASGEITFVSEQSTYYISAVDANGDVLGGVTFTFYAQFDGVSYGDIPYGADPGIIPVVQAAATDNVFGMTKVLLTDLSNDDLVDSRVTGFAFKPVKDNYGFSTTEYVDIVDDMEITAPYALLKYTLKSASGASLTTLTPETVTVYDGLKAGPVATKFAGYFTLYGSPEKDYTFAITVPEASKYHFEPVVSATNYVVNAKEQVVYGDIVDANGAILTFTTEVKVNAYDAKGTVLATSDAYVNAEHYYKVIVDVDDVAYYKPTANIVIGTATYTFGKSVSPYIYANEETILFNAVSANGHDVNATFANTAAFDSKGVKIGSPVAGGVVVDVDDVAYFQATVTPAEGEFNYHFAKQSASSTFVANESYITGSVPYSGKAAAVQKLELDFYLEGSLVSYTYDNVVFDANKYEYDAIIDMTGMVIDGVVFDSIVAVYFENGVALGSAIIDPFTPINNIISPTLEIYVATLLPSSAVIANHVDIDQIGDIVTVTADGNFFVADDEGIYTDGQYKYVFDGWYVNNEKVSTSPVFTFELTDDVVISPQYTVTYEKTSDVNKDVEKEFINIVDEVEVPVEKTVGVDTNVLIIGICAVIVALIAVVYAVIKKE